MPQCEHSGGRFGRPETGRRRSVTPSSDPSCLVWTLPPRRRHPGSRRTPKDVRERTSGVIGVVEVKCYFFDWDSLPHTKRVPVSRSCLTSSVGLGVDSDVVATRFPPDPLGGRRVLERSLVFLA